MYVCRNRAVTWPVTRPTSVALCRGDMSKCISVSIPVNIFTVQQRPVTSSTRFRSSSPAHPRRTTDSSLDDSATWPAWTSGSDKPTAVAVAAGRQPSVIYNSVGEVDASDFYYDTDGAVMGRVALMARHLGLVVGVGACALAVGVVVVVTAIVCRYRAATKASAAAPVAQNGYRRAATDDKAPVAAVDKEGQTKSGYRYGGYGRRWADTPAGDAASARASLIRCDGDGDAFVTSSITMTSSSSRRGHVTEWFV